MTNEEKFDAIKRRYANAKAREDAYRLDVLLRKYGQCRPPISWLTRGENKRIETFRRSQDRAIESMMTLLARVSDRNWYSGSPCHWIMRELTYSDAITSDALSIIPPPAYGYREQDARRFAEALA